MHSLTDHNIDIRLSPSVQDGSVVALIININKELCKALDMVVAFYKSSLKVVRALSSDSESVLKSNSINLYMNEKHGIKMRRLLRGI